MFRLITYGWVLVFVLSLTVPVWLKTRSWLACLRAMAVIVAGMLAPLLVFLLASFFQPEWKGDCHVGWVDCFHQGKVVLLPVVLWAIASFYVVDVLRVKREKIRAWVRWGLLNGAGVSMVCLLHGLVVAVAGERVLLGVWWGFLFPAYTVVWYGWRAWQVWQEEGSLGLRGATAWLPSAPFWIGSILTSQRLYQKLPDVPPSCFVVTAASRGHPWLVGSCWARGADGRLQRVNAQLVVFQAAEAVWQRRSPGTHAAFRRVYNVWGYRAAGLIRTRWLADIAYLLLKPLEWLARIGTIRPDPR